MQPVSLVVGGVAVLTIVTIAYGGTFVLRVLTGREGANALQEKFYRAGHGHAGVLVILGLVLLLLLDGSGAGAPWKYAYVGVLLAAVLIPAGFFTSVIGRDPVRPNRMIALLWAGFAVLAVSLLAGGVALVSAGVDRL